MYQELCKLLLQHMKAPMTTVLSPTQAGGCKGHTTMTHIALLWSLVPHCTGEAYVVFLDIAKAYPSTLHPLLWKVLDRIWVPHNMASII